MATPSAWVKTTPYGNYMDPKQNHKECNRNTEQYNLVHCVKNNYRHHSGSKSIHTLRMYK